MLLKTLFQVQGGKYLIIFFLITVGSLEVWYLISSPLRTTNSSSVVWGEKALLGRTKATEFHEYAHEGF